MVLWLLSWITIWYDMCALMTYRSVSLEPITRNVNSAAIIRCQLTH